MQILLVSPGMPFPGEAGSPRTYNLARRLSARHDIALLLLSSAGDGYDGDLAKFEAADPVRARRRVPEAVLHHRDLRIRPQGEHGKALLDLLECSGHDRLRSGHHSWFLTWAQEEPAGNWQNVAFL
jgi:hypothetical protein